MKTLTTRPNFPIARLRILFLAGALAAAASARAAITVTTANGRGADTFISNDSNSGPTVAHGGATSFEVRRLDGTRIRILYLRFDLTNIFGRNGATLTVNLTSANRTRDMNVYGLVDGDPGESWDETNSTYNTAPGVLPAALGSFAFNTNLVLLGTWNWSTGAGLKTSSTATLNLDSFLAADTDGQVTFVIINVASDQNADYFGETKEAALSAPPALTLPNAVGKPNLPDLRWGTGSGTWDINTSFNWKDSLGATTNYQEIGGVGNAVTFEDTVSGASPITVTLNTAVNPFSLSANATKSYTISGSGGIGGITGITKQGSGTLTLGTANTFLGTVSLQGGTLAFSSLANLGNAAAPISFNGGTLQYSGANTADISTRTVTLAAGGGTIDVGANSVTLANPIGNGGAGGLTKAGTGTLTLTGTNVYLGNTVVSQGTLALAASTYIGSSPALVVNGGAVLDAGTSGVNLALNAATGQVLSGTGTVNGEVTVPASTAISPATNGTYGTLTLGSLTASGGTLAVDVSAATHDLLNVSGNLTLNSGTLQLNVSGILTNGTYKLIQYGGALVNGPGSSGNLVLAGFAQAGQSAYLSDATAGEVDLIVAPSASDTLNWRGTGANWDLAGSLNWLNGATPWAFTNGDFVTFNDSGSGAPMVNLQTAVRPGSVTVNNTAVSPYTFADGTGSGGGKLSGPTGLAKSGTGTLIIQTANNNTGPTTIGAGTLQVGNGGGGDIGTGNVTNNSALVFAQGDTVIHDVPGQISGTGSVTMNGTTTVRLGQNNTYNGPTTIGSGVLQVGAGGGTGSLGGGNVTNNGTLTFNRTGSYSVANNISGSGALIQAGAGTMTLSGSLAYQGNTFVSNGVVKLSGAGQLPNANTVAGSTGWLILDGGAAAGTLDLGGFSQTVNALAGLGGAVNGVITNSGTSGTNTLVILGAAVTTYNGIIAGNSAGAKIGVVLLGTNELRLNGNCPYSAGTQVGSGATLGVGPAAAAGTGQIVLSNNATLFLHNAGSSSAFVANDLLIPDGAAGSVNSGQLGDGYSGNVSGGATSSNLFVGPVSLSGNNIQQWANFAGTVRVTGAGTLRFGTGNQTVNNGGDNTTFSIEGTSVMQTRDNGTVSLGALVGDGFITNPQQNTGIGVFIIGAKNVNCTYSGVFTGSNTLVKVGTGSLTLNGATNSEVGYDSQGNSITNYILTNGISYLGNTTISNGTLALVAPNNLNSNSPVITLAGAAAVLDLSQAGYTTDGTNRITDTTLRISTTIVGVPQTLAGFGTISGNLIADPSGTVSPGLPTGVLTVSGSAQLGGPVAIALNTTSTPNSGELAAANITVNPTASLTVTNLGPAFQGGEVFHLFNHAVSFPGGSVTLPPISSPLSWTNKLAIDGTIAVLGQLVNTNPTSLNFSLGGGSLVLSWPPDHLGWHLQAQTNAPGVGVTTNWVDVPGSMTTTQMTFGVSLTNNPAFYRLVYP